MSSRRVQKVAEAIREVVSMAILAELKDPRVQDVTVTYVEVSGDLRHAKVHVSVMGDDAKQQLSLRGLQSAAGFLQSRCANRIDTRYTPRIAFVLDQGVKKSIEISQILARVLPREETPDAPAAEDAEAVENAEDAGAVEDAEAEENAEDEVAAQSPAESDRQAHAPSEASHPPNGPTADSARPKPAS